MENFLTEQQQLEQLSHWWKKNGKFTLGVIALVVLISIVWQLWDFEREKTFGLASDRFEWLLEGVMTKDDKVVQTQANYILEHYPRTPYYLIAALMQAKQAVDDHDFVTAEEKLLNVMSRTSDKALKQVARLRAARVMIAENKASQALELLKKVDDNNYLPAIQSLRGDIYLAMGQGRQARQAYQEAIQLLGEQDSFQSFLQMKLDDAAS